MGKYGSSRTYSEEIISKGLTKNRKLEIGNGGKIKVCTHI
jgi:hypothetical protein